MSILDYFPSGLTPRPEQRDLLLRIEAGWAVYDVFVGRMPTGSGKTEVALTIAAWREAVGKSATYTMPTNVLVEQTVARYPQLTVMQRQDAYRCADMKRSCGATKAACKRFCSGCPYVAAKATAKRSKVKVANFYVYWAHKLYSESVIFDEAHTLVDMLTDKRDIKLWRSAYKFPVNLKTVADVIAWAQEEMRKEANPKLASVVREISRIRDGATLEYVRDTIRGKPDVMLHIKPSSARSVPPWLWPHGKVNKIVLLSATISEHDVHELGLSARRVAYLDCDSPIPAANRPFVYQPRFNMAAKYTDHAVPLLIQAIRELLDRHPDKGLIHLPYSLAQRVRDGIQHERLMFHARDNKTVVLEQFRQSLPEQGKVLVASGLYEGVDLPYDAARWQLIGKVPYLSLANEMVKQKSQENQSWYDWEAVKRILQATGRIVRAADDYGITYLHDINFKRLLDTDSRRVSPLFPNYFRDAIRITK